MHDETFKEKRLLVGVSGSISAAGVPAYLGLFRAHFKEVKVIMTEKAHELFPVSTMSLFCDEIYMDEKPQIDKKMGHVELARWADLFIVIPATANVLGQAAHGIATNLLTTTILACPHPVIYCPNMNALMWEKKVTQRNVELLREDGHHVVEPTRKMAYEVASGALKPNYILPSGQEIIDFMKEALQERDEIFA